MKNHFVPKSLSGDYMHGDDAISWSAEVMGCYENYGIGDYEYWGDLNTDIDLRYTIKSIKSLYLHIGDSDGFNYDEIYDRVASELIDHEYPNISSVSNIYIYE